VRFSLSPNDKKKRLLPPPQIWAVPAATVLFLWFTSSNQITAIQAACAFLLLLFAWWSYQYWRQTGNRALPLFSAVVAMYSLYFVVPLFWGERRTQNWRGWGRIVENQTITEVMLMVLFGMVFLWLGTRCTVGRRLAIRKFPEISLKPTTLLYVHAIAIAGVVLSRYQNGAAQGEGVRQVILIFQVFTSQVAVLILLRRALYGKMRKFEQIILVVILGLRVVLGMSSGWLGTAVGVGICCALVYLEKYRKLPVLMLACMLPFVMFFQAGKTKFRRVYWHAQEEAGATEKAEFWLDASLKAWQSAFEDSSGKQMALLLSYTSTRTALLTEAANVIEQTPAIVPYQYGRLYSYLVVTLIPRFLWPEKPSMSDANQFYQVAYGVTRQQDLNNVSIAVGALTEGYINFGWFGPPLAMLLIGVLLDFWNESFLTRGGVLAPAIGIAMIPQLLMVEYQMAQYLSSIIQYVLLTVVVFLPVVRWRVSVSRPVRNESFRMAGARF
jgi:hypothetical protein